jgi:hypothetical protein
VYACLGFGTHSSKVIRIDFNFTTSRSNKPNKESIVTFNRYHCSFQTSFMSKPLYLQSIIMWLGSFPSSSKPGAIFGELLRFSFQLFSSLYPSEQQTKSLSELTKPLKQCRWKQRRHRHGRSS